MSKFSLLSPDIYISSPTASQPAYARSSGLPLGTALSTSNGKSPAPNPIPDPELCIIFGWMGASMKHLEKYTDTYRILFPATTLLLIRSSPSHFLRLTSTHQKAFQPAATFIRARTSPLSSVIKSTTTSTLEAPSFLASSAAPNPSSSNILIHTFSNGGCYNLQTLDQIMLSTLTSPSTPATDSEDPAFISAATQNPPYEGLHPRAFIFDSCPGHVNLIISIRAFTAGITPPILKYGASALVAIVYGVLNIFARITSSPAPLSSISTYLTHSLPPSARRLYLYSSTDLLIPHKDVESHAAAARLQGTNVTLEEFEGTSHVGHARGENAGRYWGAVRRVWRGE